MKKIFATTIFTLIFLLSVFGAVNAYTVLPRDKGNVDENLSDQSNTVYAQPTKILISQIKTKADSLSTSPEDWFSMLYYYSITRLGFSDIPYNYVVDRQGTIYEGRDGGLGVVPESVSPEGAVVIGYLSNGVDLTLNSKQAMQELVGDLSYKYGIPRAAVKVVDLTMVGGLEEKSVAKATYEESNDVFTLEVRENLLGVKFFSKENLDYRGEITELKYAKSIVAGSKLHVSLKLTNKNDFAWFTDRDFIYVSTVGNIESPFAVNKEWDSFSKPTHIEDKTILPGESVVLKFDMQAKLQPGKHTVGFYISKTKGKIFAKTKFEVKFTIKKGKFDLVQVKDIEYLNVRECPAGGCKQIGRIHGGEVYISLKKELGWYRIQYTEKEKGWVYGKYVKEL